MLSRSCQLADAAPIVCLLHRLCHINQSELFLRHRTTAAAARRRCCGLTAVSGWHSAYRQLCCPIVLVQSINHCTQGGGAVEARGAWRLAG
eukprot:COSAG06_NODE_1487_length_9296_cov_19.025226_13_plen_91_part_00